MKKFKRLLLTLLVATALVGCGDDDDDKKDSDGAAASKAQGLISFSGGATAKLINPFIANADGKGGVTFEPGNLFAYLVSASAKEKTDPDHFKIEEGKIARATFSAAFTALNDAISIYFYTENATENVADSLKGNFDDNTKKGIEVRFYKGNATKAGVYYTVSIGANDYAGKSGANDPDTTFHLTSVPRANVGDEFLNVIVDVNPGADAADGDAAVPASVKIYHKTSNVVIEASDLASAVAGTADFEIVDTGYVVKNAAEAIKNPQGADVQATCATGGTKVDPSGETAIANDPGVLGHFDATGAGTAVCGYLAANYHTVIEGASQGKGFAAGFEVTAGTDGSAELRDLKVESIDAPESPTSE